MTPGDDPIWGVLRYPDVESVQRTRFDISGFGSLACMADQQLDAEKIVATVEKLHRRIAERFPTAGLASVCAKLLAISKAARDRSEQIARPIVWVRLISLILIIAVLGSAALTVWIVVKAAGAPQDVSTADWIQAVESALNDVVIIGASIFFFATLEIRIKRRRALRAIHELRSMAHIIDMHQLTKDPERVLGKGEGHDTESSPARTMSEFELSRYLDYCSEALSLTGKVAALYVQNFEDSVAVSAVNDVENLTTDMARKVWQKLMVLHAGAGPNGDRASHSEARETAPAGETPRQK